MAPLGYALVGCGSFGRFCLAAQGANPHLRRVAVCDLNPDLARAASEESGVPAVSLDEALADPEVAMVHLATPPWTHRELGEKILRAGKHLLCEKPLATSAEDADVLLALAEERGLRLMVNLIMRYTPLVETVDRVIATGWLGDPVRASLENDAQDETLSPEHWFWNPEMSGGIFVEHAVHFFDLFDHWFGPGAVVAAAAGHRKDGREDRVHAVTSHPNGALVTQTHAFTQRKIMDRQRWRLVFTRGEITLEEWIPVRMTVTCLDDLPGLADFGLQRGSDGTWTKNLASKNEVYENAVRDLASDLVRSVREPGHVRRIDEGNGLRSLRLALDARAMA